LRISDCELRNKLAKEPLTQIAADLLRKRHDQAFDLSAFIRCSSALIRVKDYGFRIVTVDSLQVMIDRGTGSLAQEAAWALALR
jgi:hypothetical protein